MKTRTLLMMLSVICLFPGPAQADRIHFYVQNTGGSTMTVQMNYTGEWSGQYGPSTIGPGQNNGNSGWGSLEKDGHWTLSGYYTVNGSQLPSSYNWTLDDQAVGQMTLTTGQPGFITLTEPTSGQYQLNFYYTPPPTPQPPGPYPSPGSLLFGGQYTLNGNVTTTFSSATGSASLAAGGSPIQTLPLPASLQEIYLTTSIAANNLGSVAGIVQVTCDGFAGFLSIRPASADAAWWEGPFGTGEGPIMAVTPPISTSKGLIFFAGDSFSDLWACPLNDCGTGSCCELVEQVVGEGDIITAMQFDPGYSQLWVGTATGYLFNCSPYYGHLWCNEYQPNDGLGVQSLAVDGDGNVTMARSNGDVEYCPGTGQESDCSLIVDQPLDQSAYVNLAYANNSIYVLSNSLVRYSVPLTTTSTPTTVIASGTRAGPTLYGQGQSFPGLATDGQNVYALADDGVSVYQCDSQDNCTKWGPYNSTAASGITGSNLTSLGAVPLAAPAP